MKKGGFVNFNKIFISILVLLLGSCMKFGKAKEDNKFQDKLLVELQIMVPLDDEFELFYRGKDEDFSADRSIRVEVKGMEKFQMVTFVFESLEYPSHIRIDFGENRAQKEMAFGHLAFRYNDSFHIFSKEEIKKFFKPNSGMDFDFTNAKVRTKEVDGKYDPYLSSFEIAYFIKKVILF